MNPRRNSSSTRKLRARRQTRSKGRERSFEAEMAEPVFAEIMDEAREL
jgi:hypothetical protein